jgi:hypothetical protein
MQQNHKPATLDALSACFVVRSGGEEANPGLQESLLKRLPGATAMVVPLDNFAGHQQARLLRVS